MKKLYFPKAKPTHYWEYWSNDDGTYTLHWGEIGTEGESATVSRRFLKTANSQVKKLEKLYSLKGYEEIGFEDQAVLAIEYVVDGFGTGSDLSKRHSLEDFLNEALGWIGLGHCDGGSIGSGTMEVFCFVIDFSVAQKALSDRLHDTEFSDYTRIYQEH